MEFTPFQMFGPQHMLTIFSTFGIALIVPYYFKNSDEETKKIAGISISVIIAYQLITQAFTTFTFNLPWQKLSTSYVRYVGHGDHDLFI